MPFLTLEKRPEYQIYFEVHGDGVPLLLVHPLMGSSETWKNLSYTRSLEGFELILVDALGHGKSSKPHDPHMYSLETAADYLVQLLDFLDIKKANFFGYSMGALFGFELATKHGIHFNSFVLGGNHPFKRPKGYMDPRIEIFEKGVDAVIAWQQPQSVQRKEYLKKQDYKALAAFLREVNTYDITVEQLSKIKNPVLIFAGDKDPMFPDIKKAADAIPSCKFIELHGLDHNHAFLRKSKIISYVVDFLHTNSDL